MHHENRAATVRERKASRVGTAHQRGNTEPSRCTSGSGSGKWWSSPRGRTARRVRPADQQAGGARRCPVLRRKPRAGDVRIVQSAPR